LKTGQNKNIKGWSHFTWFL